MSFKDTAEERKAIRQDVQKFQDFNGSWEQYKTYLDARGCLSENISSIHSRPAQSKPAWGGVPWFGKGFNDLTDGDKSALWNHLKTLAWQDRSSALEYCKYLKGHCNYPDLSTHLGKENE